MKREAKMSLGARLRQLRQAHQMTQDQASRLSGISGANISRLEDGQSPRVAAVTLAALARAYRVAVSELYQAAGWYWAPPDILDEEARRPNPQEQLLINTIRSAPTPEFRESLLQSLIDVAGMASAGGADHHRQYVAPVGEQKEPHEDEE
jgi:transcriptional regulator with XRE-family HTH domain